ncbi:hypothetical protein [[Clostridium] hylemonae]|nr:hypothetical protein [[Clostridium] hylemonae]
MSEVKTLNYFKRQVRAVRPRKYTYACNPSTGEITARVPCCT